MSGLQQPDKDAIIAVTEQVVKIANAKPTDWDTYIHLYYNDDSIILPQHAPAVKGFRAIKEFFIAFPEITNFKIEAVEVDGSDDCAWVYGTYSMTLSPPDAPPMNDVGKYIEIWKKQPDGVWKVTHDIFNSDLP